MPTHDQALSMQDELYKTIKSLPPELQRIGVDIAMQATRMTTDSYLYAMDVYPDIRLTELRTMLRESMDTSYIQSKVLQDLGLAERQGE